MNLDEASSNVNRDGVGERLFDAMGEQTVYLKGVLRFLQDYQAHFLRTQAFCKRLVELQLLQPVHLQYQTAAGEGRTLGGFQTVDRTKLKALGAADLASLLQTDELECIFLHFASQRHFAELVDKLPKDAAAA